MKATLCHLLLFSLLPFLSNAEPTELKDASVTISYGELKELLRAARLSESDEPGPPVEAVLARAKYLLDFSGGAPEMTAEFGARTFTEGWHAVPLFGGAARLDGSQDDDSLSIVRRNNVYSLLARGSGDFSAQLNLMIPPLTQWKKEDGFGFCPSSATENEIRIVGLPKDKVIRIGDLTPSRNRDGEMLYHFSGDEKELHIYLDEKEGERPVLPSSWTLHSQVMVRYEEGRLRHSARIQAGADSGSGLSLELSLPPNISRVTVDGEDLDAWRLLPRAGDSRSLRVSWKTRDILDRTLLLSWEIPQSALAETWLLTPPRIAPEVEPPQDASKTLIALLPVDGLDLTHPSLLPLEESRRLPGWLRNEVGSDDCLISEITGDDPIELAANWLPRLETTQATVSLASFETRLVPDGSMLVSADYTIQHNAPIRWAVQLPSVDQVLACEVNHEAVNPIQRADNEIEFRLPSLVKSEEGGASGTTIHLCYALQDEALDPVSGQITLELPNTELFIHRIDWSVVIPAQYEPTAVEGNVQLAGDQSSAEKQGGNLIQLEKELCRGERPAVEIYYQRKELTPGS